MQQNFAGIIIPIITILILLIILWRIGLRALKKYHSPTLGEIEVLQKYNGEKLLTINGYAQGISIEKKSLKKSYWYCVANETVKFCRIRKNPRILMLGLGANTISSLIAQQNPKIHQTIVEIDSQIIQACQEYFGLRELPNYCLIQADAYKLVNDKKTFTKKFDAIIVDIYTGKPPFVSLKSNLPNFIEKLLPWLKKEGMIIFNRPAHTKDTRKDSQKLKDYLVTLFIKTEVFDIKDPRGYRNNVIIGTTKLEF